MISAEPLPELLVRELQQPTDRRVKTISTFILPEIISFKNEKLWHRAHLDISMLTELIPD